MKKNIQEIDPVNADLGVDEVYYDGEKIQITDDMDPGMVAQMNAINDIINTDIIDNTTALNILINVAQATFDSGLLNDLDRHLIVKAFACIEDSISKCEDFIIKYEDSDDEPSESDESN